MAIEIPSEVALFLNFLGFPYPDVNEDHVRELADQVRAFAEQVQTTHAAATGVINDMGSVYSGYSYEQLVAAWARMSATNMADLDQACQVVATALDAAAVVIVTVKIAVLTELAALAIAYATVMAASVATSGLSATMGPAITAAARRLLVAMEQTLLSYILAEVIGRAIEPLEETVARVVNGFAYEATRRALGVPAATEHAPTLYIDPEEVLNYARILEKHAADIIGHAEEFAERTAELDFTTTSSGTDDGGNLPRTVGLPGWNGVADRPNAGLPADGPHAAAPAITNTPSAPMEPPAVARTLGNPVEPFVMPQPVVDPPPTHQFAPLTADGEPTQRIADTAPLLTDAPTHTAPAAGGTGAWHTPDGSPDNVRPQSAPALESAESAPPPDRYHGVHLSDQMTGRAIADPTNARAVGSSIDTTTPTATPATSPATTIDGNASTGANSASYVGGSPQSPAKRTPWARAQPTHEPRTTGQPAAMATTEPVPGPPAAQPPQPPRVTPWSKKRPATEAITRTSAPRITDSPPPVPPGASPTAVTTSGPASARRKTSQRGAIFESGESSRGP